MKVIVKHKTSKTKSTLLDVIHTSDWCGNGLLSAPLHTFTEYDFTTRNLDHHVLYVWKDER